MLTSSDLPISCMLFDLDGTLADTAPDLALALNRLLLEEGCQPQPYDAIRPVASHGTRGLVKLGFGIGVDHPDFARLCTRFLELYDACFCEETRLFDGMSGLLTVLAERGMPWGVVTNKPARFTDPLLAALPLPSMPGVTVSGDTVGVSKPDPKPMYYAAEMLGVASGIGYFILDTRDRLAYDELMATIVVIGILGYALDAAARIGYRLWTRDPASS